MRRKASSVIRIEIILTAIFMMTSALPVSAQSAREYPFRVVEIEQNPAHQNSYKVAVRFDTSSTDAVQKQSVFVPAWANEDADLRERYINATVDYRYRGDEETPGWLIVDGRLIPGPYNIAVHDSFITINNVRVYPRKPPEIDPNREVKPEIKERIRVSDSLWTAVPVWLADGGMEEAERRAVEYMLAQSIVDTAYIEEPGSMLVKYNNWAHGVNFALGSILNTVEIPEGWPRQVMDYEAGHLQAVLNHEGLVISHDGQLAYRRAPDALLVFSRLRDICTTISDEDTRVGMIREIIKNDEAARELAERFMQ